MTKYIELKVIINEYEQYRIDRIAELLVSSLREHLIDELTPILDITYEVKELKKKRKHA